MRLQWDPDHTPHGGKLERRAIQLGLRGNILKRFHEEFIQRVEDISEFVEAQRQHVLANRRDKLMSPSEHVYIPSDPQISGHIRLTGFETVNRGQEEAPVCGKTDFSQMLESLRKDRASSTDGACCAELLTKNCQRNTIGSNGDDGTRQDLIVCLGGAFNPIHTQHVQVVSETLQWIQESTKFRVVAARLAVAHDGYVKAKCRKGKQKCMKVEHRIRLCELACRDNDMIKPYPLPTGSAFECGEKVKRELSNVNAKIAVIYGADRVITKAGKPKWNNKPKHVTMCIGRKGTAIDEIREAFDEDLKLGIVKNRDFYIVEKELSNISSTDVREALAEINNVETQQSREEIIENIVKKGWINEAVGRYILENYESLYL